MLWGQVKKIAGRLFRRPQEGLGGSQGRIWCVVANVVAEHPLGEDKEIRRGTKHFSAGTKVYCYPPLWGDGYEDIKVIGRHRGSRKLVEMVMPSKWLTNWRVKTVHSPFVSARMKGHWDSSEESRERADSIVKEVRRRVGAREV
jgi:hypothetical protein